MPKPVSTPRRPNVGIETVQLCWTLKHKVEARPNITRGVASVADRIRTELQARAQAAATEVGVPLAYHPIIPPALLVGR